MIFRRRLRRVRDCVVGTLCLVVALISGILFLQAGGQSHMGVDFSRREIQGYVLSTRAYSSNLITIDDTEDYNTLARDMDLRNFQQPVFMIGNKSLCSDKVEVLVYVQSAWKNFMNRRLLRRTWASGGNIKGIRVKTIFILGRPNNTNDQVRINNEQMLHGDIIEGDFVDSSQNITIKSIIAMAWIHDFCPRVKYVIKADDDMFVNVFAIFDNVLSKMDVNYDSIACHFHNEGKSPIVRDQNSKWYIPSNIFPNMTHLPQFCSGYLVVMTSKVVRDLYLKTKAYPLINVDDVYMFGLLTQGMFINFVDISQNLTLTEATGLESYKKGQRIYLGVGVTGSSPMEELWSLALLEETKTASFRI